MKNFILLFSIFLITIIISLYFQKSNHEGFITNINPDSVTSNVEEKELGLSKKNILSIFKYFNELMNNKEN